jgi:hypothetical protein
MEDSTPECVTQKHGKPKQKAEVIESSRKLKNKTYHNLHDSQTVSGQTHQKWLDGWHMHHMREVGNTYNISVESLNGRNPLLYSGIYRDLHNPNLQPKFIFYNCTYYENPLYKRKLFQSDIGSRSDI